MPRHSPTYLRRRTKKDAPPPQDRRKFPRVQILEKIEYAYQPQAVFITGLAYNNSREGMLLGSDFPFTPGESLSIKISAPRPSFSQKGELFLTGVICWTWDRKITSALPAYEAGVRFDKCIPPATISCLHTLLRFKP